MTQPEDGDACDILTLIGETCTYADVECVCQFGPGGVWDRGASTGTAAAGGAAGGVCPASAPGTGDACTVEQLTTICSYGDVECACEFGGGGIERSCGDVGIAGAGGAGGDPCPATEPGDGDACTFAQLNLTCEYAAVSCTCEGGGGGLSWVC